MKIKLQYNKGPNETIKPKNKGMFLRNSDNVYENGPSIRQWPLSNPLFCRISGFLEDFFLITENTWPVAFKYEIKYKINMYMDRNYIPNLLAHPFALHISKHS